MTVLQSSGLEKSFPRLCSIKMQKGSVEGRYRLTGRGRHCWVWERHKNLHCKKRNVDSKSFFLLKLKMGEGWSPVPGGRAPGCGGRPPMQTAPCATVILFPLWSFCVIYVIIYLLSLIMFYQWKGVGVEGMGRVGMTLFCFLSCKWLCAVFSCTKCAL